MELSQLNTSLWFLQKHKFLEFLITVVSLHNSLGYFLRLRWAYLSINLVVLLALGWLRFIILKAPKLTGQPTRLDKQ